MSYNKYREMKLDELSLRWNRFNPITKKKTLSGERVEIKRQFKKDFPQAKFNTGKRGTLTIQLMEHVPCLYTKKKIDKVENWGVNPEKKNVIKMDSDGLWKIITSEDDVYSSNKDKYNWYYVTPELIYDFYHK